MNITIGDHHLDLHIRYSSKRTTIQMKLSSSETLEVVAPQSCPNHEILELIQHKHKWLNKHISQLKALAKLPLNKTVNDGSEVLFLGNPHTLRFHQTADAPRIDLAEQDIHVYLPLNISQEETAAFIKSFYINSAKQLLTERTRYWSALLGVFPKKVCIKQQKTRWGSCSSSGTINYNWQIIMAPPHVIDYLVIHELSHILVPNHSDRFWQIVAHYMPNYLQCRKWLKEHGNLLKSLF